MGGGQSGSALKVCIDSFVLQIFTPASQGLVTEMSKAGSLPSRGSQSEGQAAEDTDDYDHMQLAQGTLVKEATGPWGRWEGGREVFGG